MRKEKFEQLYKDNNKYELIYTYNRQTTIEDLKNYVNKYTFISGTDPDDCFEAVPVRMYNHNYIDGKQKIYIEDLNQLIENLQK